MTANKKRANRILKLVCRQSTVFFNISPALSVLLEANNPPRLVDKKAPISALNILPVNGPIRTLHLASQEERNQATSSRVLRTRYA